MSTPPSDIPTVSTVMLQPDQFPVLDGRTLLKTALEKMAAARLGVVCIVAADGTLSGVFTDGDIRRKLLTVQKPFSAFFSDDVADHITRNPASILPEASLRQAIDLMEQKQVWDLPVVDSNNKLLGLLHLHPVVKKLLGD